jgi:asparagine synthase (glutamine-hydrolysing)
MAPATIAARPAQRRDISRTEHSGIPTEERKRPMCGLAGVWRKDGGEASPDALLPMIAVMRYRGPDDTGSWHSGRTALAHCRLSILDLSTAGHQPMATDDGRGVLAYNGEVYNYRELRNELEAAGVAFKGSGDTEVVLQALHHWGPAAAIPRFDGMFAFAYIDLREPALWLARDRVGIKPLVVADTGRELLFASESKALLAHPAVPRKIDQVALVRGVAKGWLSFPGSLFAGMEELEPGSWWKVSEHGIERNQYFHVLTTLDVERLVAAQKTDSRDFVETFQQKMRRSVRLHLASDVPLAALCSGGVDSSLITAYTKLENPAIVGYVADAPVGEGEAAQAERVGRHLGVEIRRVPVDRERFLRLWPHAVWHSDKPSMHPSDAAFLALTQSCRADGIKVLLTGEGSDELFGGYAEQGAIHRRLRRMTWLNRLSPPRVHRRRIEKWQRTQYPLQRGMAHYADEELLTRRMLDLLVPIESMPDRVFLARCFADLYHHLSWILHRHDRLGMAASIEMRVPFLENDLFDFAFHLPRRAKLHRGLGKWLVKQAALASLPRNVVLAKKKGFPVPAAYSRGSERLLAGGLLAGELGWSSTATELIMSELAQQSGLRFLAVGLELWLQLYFGNETPDALGERLVAAASD